MVVWSGSTTRYLFRLGMKKMHRDMIVEYFWSQCGRACSRYLEKYYIVSITLVFLIGSQLLNISITAANFEQTRNSTDV